MSKSARDIYQQHESAFKNVSAYVIVKNNKEAARIAFKHPKNGDGRVYCYFHFLGIPAVRGWCDGGGYDKMTSSCIEAILKSDDTAGYDDTDHNLPALKTMVKDNGVEWKRQLESAGYQVFKAV